MKTPGHYIRKTVLIGAVIIVVAGTLSFGLRTYVELLLRNRTLAIEHADDLKTLQYTEQFLENQLAASGQSNAYLSQQLANSENQNNAIESQVQQISGTVGNLTKLSQTDPQLLEKYSRVYFLNENYVPASLSTIPATFTYAQSKPQQFLTPALPFLTNMLIAANNAGVPLQVVSAYRSFGTQTALKTDYIITYGTGANAFSAEQGYSEHQLGTAVDLTVPGVAPVTLAFASSSGYAWLTANAYQYGFELSYPPKNPYYIFEPWHWRFVGIDLATWLHDTSTTFYDADQRTINTYLVSLFNQN